MISSIAKMLIRLRLYKLAGFLLSAASVIMGTGSRIEYNKKGYWTHKQKGWFLNEAFPDIRLNIARLKTFMDEVYFFNYTPVAGDICIDVGAGIGTETMYISEKVGAKGMVYAIEAAPRTFRILQENVLANQLPNIACFNLAISDNNERLKISASSDNHITNSVFRGEGEYINALTMDQFLETNHIHHIDYLKVNIEGAEKLLVRKFNRISTVHFMAISCHDFLGRRLNDPNFFTRETITTFLAANNFSILSRNTGIDYMDDWIYGVNKNLVNS